MITLNVVEQPQDKLVPVISISALYKLQKVCSLTSLCFVSCLKLKIQKSEKSSDLVNLHLNKNNGMSLLARGATIHVIVQVNALESCH